MMCVCVCVFLCSFFSFFLWHPVVIKLKGQKTSWQIRKKESNVHEPDFLRLDIIIDRYRSRKRGKKKNKKNFASVCESVFVWKMPSLIIENASRDGKLYALLIEMIDSGRRAWSRTAVTIVCRSLLHGAGYRRSGQRAHREGQRSKRRRRRKSTIYKGVHFGWGRWLLQSLKCGGKFIFRQNQGERKIQE